MPDEQSGSPAASTPTTVPDDASPAPPTASMLDVGGSPPAAAASREPPAGTPLTPEERAANGLPPLPTGESPALLSPASRAPFKLPSTILGKVAEDGVSPSEPEPSHHVIEVTHGSVVADAEWLGGPRALGGAYPRGAVLRMQASEAATLYAKRVAKRRTE